MVRKQIVSKEKPITRPFPIRGSLRTHYQAWKSLTDNSWVLRSVLGHRLEWNHTPPGLSLAPLEQRMSQEKEKVLDQEISDLLQKSAIEPTSDVGFLSQLFVVQKKGGGWRPIINLKRLNVYLDIKHFKMEGIYSLLQRSDWMDLSDAYLTVPIHPSDRKYLKFCWNDRCYQFRSVPFGLATAPRTFTKLMKPMVIQMRNRDVRLIVYLDDILILAQSTQLLRAHMKMVAQMLESLGFKLNLKKCEWEPSQCIEFLGFLVNSTSMTISLPLTKLQKVQKECRALLRRTLVTPRQLAQLIGLMTASIPAVAQAPMHYRAIQRLRNRALLNKRYDDEVQMDEASELDLHWWIHQLRSHNGRPLMTPVASLIITSDASNIGWGATCHNSRTGGPWSSEERKVHINWLELKAAFLALKTFVSNWRDIHVLLLIDNVTAISFINHKGGTHSRRLSDLALMIWSWCLQRNITICAEHIPGVDSVKADQESRKLVGLAEWMLNGEIFKKILKRWGPLEVDLFAARHNHQLQRYYSYRPDPGAEAIDALAQSWKDLNPYAFPAFNLLGRCLRKIKQEQVQSVVVIAPVWQGQSRYPIMLESLVDVPVLLPHSAHVLVNPAGLIHSLVRNNSLRLAAWRVSGNPLKTEEFQRKLSKSYLRHGDHPQRSHTLQRGESGWAGDMRGS